MGPWYPPNPRRIFPLAQGHVPSQLSPSGSYAELAVWGATSSLAVPRHWWGLSTYECQAGPDPAFGSCLLSPGRGHSRRGRAT